jgi:twitching motility protein PilI
MMDTHEVVQRETSAETLVSSEREKLAVSDITNSGACREVLGPWLSPSEALTRFVPSGTAHDWNIQSIAPVRFGARVGDIGLLVPLGMLSEVVEDVKIYPLPTTPQWFHGLINLRGSLIPVFNLKMLFQMDDKRVETTNLLVLNTGEAAVGLLIDGLPVTLDASESIELFPMLPPALREYSKAVYVQDDEVWVEFDFDGFFGAVCSQNIG